MSNIVHHYQHLPEKYFPWVESVWMVENGGTEKKPLIILPDGRIDIHFFRAPRKPLHISLAGIDTQPSSAEIYPGARVFGVGLFPLAAEYLLEMPLGDLINGRAQLTNGFWSTNDDDTSSFERFQQRILQQFDLLEPRDIDPRKLKMFTALHQSQGQISVAELADHCHWSTRQINRYFNQWLGLSVKTYSSILRFRASFPTLKSGKLFPESDFVDQSHFIKEIKKYSGHTPKQLSQNHDDRFIQLSILK